MEQIESTGSQEAKQTTRSLNALRPGERARVQLVSSANRKLCSKLLTMGIVAGTVIEVIGVAPLGDPMKVRTLGYELSLRLAEAAEVIVSPLAS